MGKQSGLADNLYLAGIDLSGDVGVADSISMPRNLLDVTGIDKSARERIHGLQSGKLSFHTFFNDLGAANRAAATGSSFLQLSSLPTADVIANYYRGTAFGGPACGVVAKQVNYDLARGADGSLMMAVDLEANGFGLEWGQSLTTGKRTDTTATAPATGVDFTTVSTAFGLAAYLHVFSFTGTSATMTIQDSADNAAFANITGLSAFTAASGVTSQRIETDVLTRTIRRYLKVNTTGTFSNVVFAVVVVRYAAANRGLS